MLPILRDILESSNNLSEKLVKKEALKKFYDTITKRALHFTYEKKSMISTRELINVYEELIPGFMHTQKGIKTLKEHPSENIYDYLTRRYSRKKYDVENLTENIKLKNICALKLRNLIEESLYLFVRSILKNNKKLSEEKFNKEFTDSFTVQKKISLIKDNYLTHISAEQKHTWDNLSLLIYKYKPIANDFHHMVNSYITPMLEMPLEKSRGMIKNIEDIRKTLLI